MMIIMITYYTCATVNIISLDVFKIYYIFSRNTIILLTANPKPPPKYPNTYCNEK